MCGSTEGTHKTYIRCIQQSDKIARLQNEFKKSHITNETMQLNFAPVAHLKLAWRIFVFCFEFFLL